uniref:Uncharacterized protein n=1 Tax=Fagus sylvatica TaxID=28930 RepID=A0A2N9EST2_FAGSY
MGERLSGMSLGGGEFVEYQLKFGNVGRTKDVDIIRPGEAHVQGCCRVEVKAKVATDTWQ